MRLRAPPLADKGASSCQLHTILATRLLFPSHFCSDAISFRPMTQSSFGYVIYETVRHTTRQWALKLEPCCLTADLTLIATTAPAAAAAKHRLRRTSAASAPRAPSSRPLRQERRPPPRTLTWPLPPRSTRAAPCRRWGRRAGWRSCWGITPSSVSRNAVGEKRDTRPDSTLHSSFLTSVPCRHRCHSMPPYARCHLTVTILT